MFTVFEDEKPCVIDIALYIYIYIIQNIILTSQHTPCIYLYLFGFQIKVWHLIFFDIICILFWQQKLVTQ